MITAYEAVWIRTSAHIANINDGRPEHWRCFIDRKGPMISVVMFEVEGLSTPENHQFGTARKGVCTSKDRSGTQPDCAEPNGLSAWVDYFGNIRIDENGIARIQLLVPRK